MRLLIFAYLLILSTVSFSQTSNFVSASQQSESSSLKVNWTIGELISEDFKNSSVLLSPGIETVALFVITGDVDVAEAKMQVYPVPFINEFYIESPSEDFTDAQLFLLDESGRVTNPNVEFPSDRKAVVKTHAYSSGTYFLHIKTNSSAKTFKLIKQ
jgi:hypothetical protein